MEDSRYVLYFAPHQDDELNNCGMSIIRDVGSGAKVSCVLCTDGGASGARRMLCDGKDCSLHPGRHLFSLSREEFAAARDREFAASCRELGVSADGIVISPLRQRDGELTPEAAKEIMLDAIRGLPAGSVTIKTIAPFASLGQHPDHTAVGLAALELESEGAVDKAELFFEPIHLGLIDRNDIKLKKIGGDGKQRAAFLEASACYGRWDPANGFYAIGHHSVKDEFELLAADPASWVVE